MIDGNEIEKTCYTKNLGVIIDNNLSFQAHMDKLIPACRRQLMQLAKVQSVVPNETFTTIVESLVLAKLHYGVAVWGNAAHN